MSDNGKSTALIEAYEWSDRFYLQVFRLARDGVDEKKIAESIGVPLGVFRRWRREKPALMQAYREGRTTGAKRKKTAKEMDGLHDKQRIFVHEFLVDLNATKAAQRAGYGKAGAHVQGFKNLKNPKVQQAIYREIQERIQRTDIKADRVVRELTALAFSDPKDLFDSDGVLKQLIDMEEPIRRSVSMVEVSRSGDVRVKFWDKVSALNLLMKHLGMLNNGPLPPIDEEEQRRLERQDNPYLEASDDDIIEAKETLDRLKQRANGARNHDE